MKINAPCMGCTERLPEGVCHESCNRYKDFIEQKTAITNKMKQDNFVAATVMLNEKRRRKSRSRKEANFNR